MVDGLKWHNSLTTISFAALWLCVRQFFKPFTTCEISYLITMTFATSFSVIRLLRRKWAHAKPQRRKDGACGAGALRILEYPNTSERYANNVDPSLQIESENPDVYAGFFLTFYDGSRTMQSDATANVVKKGVQHNG